MQMDVDIIVNVQGDEALLRIVESLEKDIKVFDKLNIKQRNRFSLSKWLR